ncbi:MAG: DUF1178 family protein [Kordiimonadaceae bacterium]|jgi:hypothetical protein|nr:DUF1178 family protein [Kordiimonadaceae bacterium]MDB4044482.1 DUF1178 family protein [Emcibacteraceae bacterium]MDB4591310.1 DUF1178 family protein [Flavobacteriaceae bacterium]MBT6135631.1 DUF1178 family protein [Kordiimonadaceae bacterium]MBT6467753.1 DUF1178 family protein [Kordiimonadaceae bacterium]|tara:strand:- start:16871 stop:17374 length:504 start_codon:yes stop_codon:yes gene_type:complete
MILFDIKCSDGHIFEAWFQNNEAYEQQIDNDLVECPLCGCTKTSKSLMSPNISAKGEIIREAYQSEQDSEDHKVTVSAHSNSSKEVSSDDVKRALDHMHNTMSKFRRQVEKSCEYVGDDFADEARKIHAGESEKRGIYGETTISETEELLEEGIDILPVPGLNKLDS